MKLATYEHHGRVRLGAVLSNNRILDLDAAADNAEMELLRGAGTFETALRFLEAGEGALEAARRLVQQAETGEAPDAAVVPLDSVQLLPPVPDTRKLFCLAGNYKAHIEEGGRQAHAKEETYPYFFMKPASTALVGSGATVYYPEIIQKLDYEGELTIVIGKRGRMISAAEADEYVAGYTILNDISERGLLSKAAPKAQREQDKFFDWLVGKWFDTSAPMGPWIVTKDEIADPHALPLQTRVNGEIRQNASTADMIFTVGEIIEFISRIVTLEPGDLISTGTPSGVGSARGVFLRPGDRVEVEIQGLGVLESTIGNRPA